ncbi:MAG TPA: nucleotide sugar dehydrogenase, partial [Nitrospirae bacterium]|nr:nucleotide sugar dehydrogenase [Nitrospirota bacterium]
MIKDYLKKKRSIAVVGLGYVGLPLAVELAKIFHVIGFDIKKNRIEELSSGFDSTGEASKKDLKSVKIDFTGDPGKLGSASLLIVAVPTPIDKHNIPDLSPLESASRIVGENMQKGTTVVFESTVYPGVT